MKLNEVSFGHASAVVVAVFYVGCALLVAVLPDLFRAISQSWFHGIDIGSIWTGSSRGNFVLGLVSAVVLGWVSGWGFARVYNKLTK